MRDALIMVFYLSLGSFVSFVCYYGGRAFVRSRRRKEDRPDRFDL